MLSINDLVREFKKVTIRNSTKMIFPEFKLENKTLKELEKESKKLVQETSLNQSKRKKVISVDVSLEEIPENSIDNYTPSVLKTQYYLHKEYVNGRIKSMIDTGTKFRMPAIPEDISENIVKFILRNKCNDRTSSWNCKSGDLFSEKEGKQECKCFTSDGPLSFTPSTEWNVIYFLDARHWLEDKFILYRINLKRTSVEWKNIRMNKNETFENQCDQGRRPRLSWDLLYPQISSNCVKIYEGVFNDIFTPVKVM